jgi:hypothetical protein
MTLFNLKRRGTCSVCPVLWEERHREVPPYPDYAQKLFPSKTKGT